jgi:hypothetical protein
MTDRKTLPHASFWPKLALHEEIIARQWLERMWASYPPETAAFIAAQADPFANPVGDRARRAARAFAHVLATPCPVPEEEEELAAALEDLMRVRAIQVLTPEEAVGVFFAMKEILRAFAVGIPGGEAEAGALLELETRVDRIVLAAFGQYSRCRETLFAIRAEEIRRRQAPPARFPRPAESEEEEKA